MKLSRLMYLACAAAIALLSQPALSAGGNDSGSLSMGEHLPYLGFDTGGEISVSNNDISMMPWNSKSLEKTGKVQLVHYVPANRRVALQNQPFSEAVIERQFSTQRVNKTVIVHMADTMSLLRGLVVTKLADRKSLNQEVRFVIDDDGAGLSRWGIKNKSHAIIILDGNGKLLFVKDGALSEAEIEQTIEMIERQVT